MHFYKLFETLPKVNKYDYSKLLTSLGSSSMELGASFPSIVISRHSLYSSTSHYDIAATDEDTHFAEEEMDSCSHILFYSQIHSVTRTKCEP